MHHLSIKLFLFITLCIIIINGLDTKKLKADNRLKLGLDKLNKKNKERALNRLAKHPQQDKDNLRVDDGGDIFYVDDLPDVSKIPLIPIEVKKRGVAATIPLLHSRKGAANILYIDFDGETISGTQWSSTPMTAKPMNLGDSTVSDWSDYEAAVITAVWQAVSEDYAPWNIDVTTERPATFTTRTGHIVVTLGESPLPYYSSSGGIAYVGVFGASNYYSYRPGFCYYNNVGYNAKGIAECVSHEFGHNLGLSHDGQGDSSYYLGTGSLSDGWAPIMGAGYYASITQFSKGEYTDATNLEDDLAIIGGLLPFAQVPTAVTQSKTSSCTANYASKGLITSSASSNTWTVSTNAASSVTATLVATLAPNYNFGALVQMFDSSNNNIKNSTFSSGTATLYVPSVRKGVYRFLVRGNESTDPESEYPAYGSIGSYDLSICIKNL